jgi:peptidyl-prolyl cis-trans isomerase B (cyclophilin B)
VPTSKQRREAARRHLERQLQRRQQRDARRRQLSVIGTVIGTLVILGIVITTVVMLTNDNKKTTDAAASPSDSGTTSASPSSSAKPGECAYNAEDASNPNQKDVGKPTANAPITGTENVKMVTSRGEIDIQLNRALAPCSVHSWDYLISKKFYDNTPCHRLVNSGIFVLQCGDPSGTGSGGATNKYAEENVAKANYAEGVVAMAKTSAPATTGTQFFIIWKDSTTLPKEYSVVGKVTKGLDIVKQVAAGGLAADQTAPKLAIKITSITVAS